MVSDKMALRFEQYTYTTRVEAKLHHVIPDDRREVKLHLQQVVNAAWTEFDMNDVPNYPDQDTPEGLDWFTEDEDGFVSSNPFDVQYWIAARVIRYADPQDLMFKGEV